MIFQLTGIFSIKSPLYVLNMSQNMGHLWVVISKKVSSEYSTVSF